MPDKILRNIKEYQKDGILYKDYNWREDYKHRKKAYVVTLSENNPIQIICKTLLQKCKEKYST